MWADVEEPCGYADIADIDNRLPAGVFQVGEQI